jgi:TBC1 domain family member 13
LHPKTWQKLDQLEIDPFFYSFRWITLLFSQEFEMFETLKVWESIFAHDDRITYTNFIALSLLISSASIIAKGDYS